MLLAKGQRNVIVYLYTRVIIVSCRLCLMFWSVSFCIKGTTQKAPQKKKHSSSFPRLKEYENSRLLSHPLARPFVVKEEEKDLIKRRI